MRGSYSGLERVRKDSRLREGVAVERGTEMDNGAGTGRMRRVSHGACRREGRRRRRERPTDALVSGAGTRALARSFTGIKDPGTGPVGQEQEGGGAHSGTCQSRDVCGAAECRSLAGGAGVSPRLPSPL